MSNANDTGIHPASDASRENGAAPAKKHSGPVIDFFEAIKANVVKAVVSGLFVGLGLLVAYLATYTNEYVQTRIDKTVAQALEAKTSETKKALFEALKLGISDQHSEFRDSVVQAVREDLKQSEARKVGALTSGTIELRDKYPEHTIYFYLPKTNHGKLWLSVQPRNAVADKDGAIVRIVLDNTSVAGYVENLSAEYPVDLNEKLQLAAGTQKGLLSAVIDPNTGLPPQQPLQPATLRFGDLHTVTFRAHEHAFGPEGNANIWIKYLVLVSPTIMME